MNVHGPEQSWRDEGELRPDRLGIDLGRLVMAFGTILRRIGPQFEDAAVGLILQPLVHELQRRGRMTPEEFTAWHAAKLDDARERDAAGEYELMVTIGRILEEELTIPRTDY